MNANEGLKLLGKLKKNRGGGSGQGGCERRIKVFVEMKKIGVGVGL